MGVYSLNGTIEGGWGGGGGGGSIDWMSSTFR